MNLKENDLYLLCTLFSWLALQVIIQETSKKTSSLSTAPPIRKDPVSPSVSLSHQDASIILLSFSIRGQTENHNHRKVTNLKHKDRSLV